MFRKYFPRGIAKGEPFFNRTEELKRLVGNINSGTHTLLMAPRRYGKSSLAKQAILATDHLYVEIDLFVAVNSMDVGNKIIHAAEVIIQQLSSEPENWFKGLREYFNKAEKKWLIGIKGLKLELIPHDIKTVPQNILDILNALEYILKKNKKRAIIYIDEFQEIVETDDTKAIEGAIRHFAQECEQVVFIFSGSNRKMLHKLFNDRSRPLYALCDEIRLGRIDASYYVTYLQKISQKTLGQDLKKSVINKILELTDRHPRYVYILCTELWIRLEEKKEASVKLVENVWKDYIFQKIKDTRLELSSRTATQVQLLREIALGKNQNLSSKENIILMGLTSSTIVQALKVLEELDYIERLENSEYRIIDPVIKHTLSEIYSIGEGK